MNTHAAAEGAKLFRSAAASLNHAALTVFGEGEIGKADTLTFNKVGEFEVLTTLSTTLKQVALLLTSTEFYPNFLDPTLYSALIDICGSIKDKLGDFQADEIVLFRGIVIILERAITAFILSRETP